MAVAAAALFLLYPGFLLSNEAMTMHLAFLQINIFMASLIATIYSVRRPSRALLWTILALVGAFLNLAISEYWFFLELLRPAIIWNELARQEPDRQGKIRRTFLRAPPFLSIFTGFLLVRAFNIGGINGGHAITFFTTFKSNPVSALVGQGSQIFSDLWLATAASFGGPFTLPGLTSRSLANTILLIGLLLPIGLLFFLWLRRQDTVNQDHFIGPFNSTALGYLAAGVVCLVLAGPPIWVAGLHIYMDTTGSHLTLPFMPGACLLVVGLVGLVFQPVMKPFFYSLLVAFLAVFQLLNSFNFARDWQSQETFLWQLSQRMPSLKPGTQLLTDGIESNLHGENSITAMINWMYTPPGTAGPNLVYFFFQNPDHAMEAMDRVVHNRTDPYPTILGSFTAHFQVALKYRPGFCLRVLDPDLDSHNKMLPPHLRQAAGVATYTAIEPAVVGAAVSRPPVEIIGNNPPPDNWCTAFEKASLAAQAGDWAQVTAIGDQAFGRGFKPNAGMELVVFIEGYAHSGDWRRSLDLLNQALQRSPDLNQVICYLKPRLPASSQPSADQQEFLDALQCSDGNQ